MSGPSDPEKTPAPPAWLDGIARSLEESRVEPWEPTPVGHDENGRPILSNRDWLKMAERNRDGWEPAPEWMERVQGMRLTPDDASVALRGMVRGAEREADERTARVQGKGAAKVNAGKRARIEAEREAARRSVDNRTRYADEAEALGIPGKETKRGQRYLRAYALRLKRDMSREDARREAGTLASG